MTKRHQVDIFRPSTELSGRGQPSGDPTTLFECVPVSIETLSGLDLWQARKQYAEARFRVKLNGDPNNRLKTEDYLVFGDSTLHIGFIDDKDQTGTDLTLLCKERT